MAYRLIYSIAVAASIVAVAAKHAPEPPITLPDKYAADKYARLQPFERERCDRYVKELTLMEKRRRLGLHAGEAEKMQARSVQIDKDYDRYCLNAKPAV